MNELKPVGKDMRLLKALQPTQGWNPIVLSGKVAKIRCMNCGALMAIAPADMAGEWEHKCTSCGHVHVVNRRPHRLDSRQQEANERMTAAILEGLR
jgi:DNA-directed RNA polymerase subunit RPC12/RpoP